MATNSITAVFPQQLYPFLRISHRFCEILAIPIPVQISCTNLCGIDMLTVRCKKPVPEKKPCANKHAIRASLLCKSSGTIFSSTCLGYLHLSLNCNCLSKKVRINYDLEWTQQCLWTSASGTTPYNQTFKTQFVKIILSKRSLCDSGHIRFVKTGTSFRLRFRCDN